MSSKRFRSIRVYEYTLTEINRLADRFAELDRKIRAIWSTTPGTAPELHRSPTRTAPRPPQQG